MADITGTPGVSELISGTTGDDFIDTNSDLVYTDERDTLTGGTGADTFYLSSNSTSSPEAYRGPGRAIITDFEVGIDTFDGVFEEPTLETITTNGQTNTKLYHNYVNKSVPEDLVAIFQGVDLINGDSGDNTLGGIGFDNLLNGLDGNDLLNGDGGDDTLNGGVGLDTLNGDDGNDTLNGGENNDTLNGGKNNDLLNGDEGDDSLNGGDDSLNGDEGSDTIFGNGGNDTLNGGYGDDLLRGDSSFELAPPASRFGNDLLNGGPGNDTLYGGYGDDTVNGGEDDDLIMISEPYGNILFGGGADVINGDGGNDTLIGGTRRDTLVGGANDDILNGRGSMNSREIDYLTGGTGADTFVIDQENNAYRDMILPPGFVDSHVVITDFEEGIDQIDGAAHRDDWGTIFKFDGTNTEIYRKNDWGVENDLIAEVENVDLTATYQEELAANIEENLRLVNEFRAGQSPHVDYDDPTLNDQTEGLSDLPDNPLPPLTLDVELTAAAYMHALDLEQSNVGLSHTGSNGSTSIQRAQEIGYTSLGAGENAAFNGYSLNGTNSFKQWLNSSGHRGNMMSAGYTEIGIGYFNKTGVQLFGKGNIDPNSFIPPDILEDISAVSEYSLPQVPSNLIVGHADKYYGDDILTGSSANETLHGSWGNDTILGNGGEDVLFGGMGSDSLNGGSGDDTLNAYSWVSSETDTLVGGPGADTFVFTQEDIVGNNNYGGISIVKDFEVGIDEIDATGLSYRLDGSDTIIYYTTGHGDENMVGIVENVDLT